MILHGSAAVRKDLPRLGSSPGGRLPCYYWRATGRGRNQNLSPEQWYDGLRWLLGQQLDLDDELDAFWLAHSRLGPLQRWFAALKEVLLERIPGRIVIFVEEVDTVLSLKFSTDEFFAGIRECHNRRTQDRAFERLTFCLLGVASPSDLIRDTRTTPFNIGRRIELTDFTEAEAAPLADGLVGGRDFTTETRRHGAGHRGKTEEEAGALLRRVLYWTGGHRYLTQRLCRAIAEARGAREPSASSPWYSPCLRVSVVKPSALNLVDRLCQELFLSHRAQERDDNLLFVRDRLLRSEADVASLLSLYARVRAPRQKVPDDETNPLVSLLRLSGVVREREGNLEARNRIYARVFDRTWVETNLPDAEVRRLRAEAREEARKRRQAEEGQRALRRLLYVANMNVAQQAWEVGNVDRATELLESLRPGIGEADLRGFEWRYLWRLCQGEAQATLRGHSMRVFDVAFSPDGRFLATVAGDQDQPEQTGEVKLWNLTSQTQVAALPGTQGCAVCVAFSPDGRILATGSADSTVKLWDVERQHEIASLDGHTDGWIWDLAFSPDGRFLASAGGDWVPSGPGTIRLWDLATQGEVAVLREETGDGRVCGVAFSPDGTILASGGDHNVIRLWDVASGRRVAAFPKLPLHINKVAFSPDGKMLASGHQDHTVKLWDPTTRQELATLSGHTGMVLSLAFSPAGDLLASGSMDSRPSSGT